MPILRAKDLREVVILPKKPWLQIIIAKSAIDPLSECWNWIGRQRNHYGQLRCGSYRDKTEQNFTAHRVSYEVFIGPIPVGMDVCHRCDNRLCINPTHLFLGTRQDNMDDMWFKGRGRPLRGESHGRSRLDTAKVLEIRRRYRNGEPIKRIAFSLGMAATTIRHACLRDTWDHVKEEA